MDSDGGKIYFHVPDQKEGSNHYWQFPLIPSFSGIIACFRSRNAPSPRYQRSAAHTIMEPIVAILLIFKEYAS
jgi:hypothetical protein